MATTRASALQHPSFTFHDLRASDNPGKHVLHNAPAKLGVVAFDPVRQIAACWGKPAESKKGKHGMLCPSAVHRVFPASYHREGPLHTAAAVVAGLGDGGGGVFGSGDGKGGGGNHGWPFGGGNAGDGHRGFDWEECALCCGAVLVVALGLWTRRNKECRGVLRWAANRLRKGHHRKSIRVQKSWGGWGFGEDIVGHIQGLVQSATVLFSQLDVWEQLSGGLGSVSSSSRDAFPLSAFAALSLPFLSLFGYNPPPEEETPAKLTEVWEVQGDSWTRLVPGGLDEDEWISDGRFRGRPDEKAFEGSAAPSISGEAEVLECRHELGLRVRKAADEIVGRLKSTLLPEGFPHSVTEDYAEYSTWRLGQIVASQVNGVLAARALLYAVGLGKGAIPTAAAVNWVLKDGIGYLSKIALSRYGRHFDVHPKGWRLFCDAVEDVSYGLELLTPAFPKQFLYLGAAASALRSGSGMGQAATRNSFYTSFSKQGNLAELVAKAEAQGMFAKSIGIPLGILVAARVGHAGPALALTYGAVTLAHLFCNLRSYQAVQLRTLNPDRVALVLAEFVRSGRVPSIKAVNAEDPLFPAASALNLRAPLKKLSTTFGQVASPEELSAPAKDLALGLASKIELGAELRSVCSKPLELEALRNMYKEEKYMLTQQGENIKVVLRKGARQEDMLRALTQAVYLETKGQQETKSNPLETSYRSMTQSFDTLRREMTGAGYIGELVVRPSPARLVA